MSTAGDGLTPQQKLFAYEYIADPSRSAGQAARRAGYSERTADSQASRLLKNVKVKAFIDKALEKVHRKLEVTAERIEAELAEIAFADIAEQVEVEEGGAIKVKTFDEMPKGSTRSIAGIQEKRRILTSSEGDGKGIILDSTLTLKHHDKVAALKILAQHKGMLKEQVEHTGAIEVNITKKVVTVGAGD